MDISEKTLRKRLEITAGKGRIQIRRSDLTRAAVLLPIVFRDDEPRVILTRRTMTVATHKGQISFPGGVREASDRDEVANALRETREEIGISPAHIEVLGVLDDFATITGFAVTPVVGFVHPEAGIDPDPVEVQEVIEIKLASLADPHNHELVTAEHEDVGYRYHRYTVGDHIVWGATAGILFGFLNRLGGEASHVD